MVGGKVIKVVVGQDKVWCRVKETTYRDTSSVSLVKDEKSLAIAEGDSIWWQGRKVMWTPNGMKDKIQGVTFDIVLQRIGYAPSNRPRRKTNTVTL